jgi:glycosyltransferase involved in cell wall biosynthesis
MTTALSIRDTRPTAQHDKLHVVHGVLSLELGGLERLVLDLVREGTSRGQRTSVICVERCGRLAAQAEELGASVHCLDKRAGRSPKTIVDATGLLGRLQPDIVHTHQVGALWHLGHAAREVGVPVLHTEHSDHIAHSRSWYAKLRVWWVWRQAAPLADSFCCVSDDIARTIRHWRAVPRERLRVITNGIDTSLYQSSVGGGEVRQSLGIPAGALVLGTVGRLVEVKRQDLLIRALAALRSLGKHTNTWLLIVGDGPERQRLEQLATSLGVRQWTVFAGYQPQPHRFYPAMDLFVLTSRHEGLPLALLEAWAAGLAVVASAVGGITKTISHGQTGLLFESGNERALVETLAGLLDTPAWMNQLGRHGRTEVQARFSLDRMTSEYESAYTSLVRQPARSIR